MSTPTISLSALRRHVVSHQGFAGRPRRARAGRVEEEIRRLSCVQLDSISTVERSHRIVLTSRVGVYPAGTVSRLLAEGRVFEYWAHEASLVPVEDFPLFRWRMDGRGHWGTHERALAEHPEVVEHVLEEIRERGPLGSRDFDGEGGTGMWAWKPAKQVLDSLWDRGDLSIAGRRGGFQRLYDLTERVIPRAVLETPVPTQAQALRALVLRAVRGRGALTESGIAEHYRVPGRTASVRPHVEALEADGLLRRLRVEDGGPDVLVPGSAELGESVPSGATLLSPFDNLLWDRPFAERLFGFSHVMEIYKPAPQRVFGYYVLPVLRGDRLVGRADVKSDRRAGLLRLVAFHREAGVRDSAALHDSLDRALARLARTAGLEGVAR
ncbi:MAG: YcaQ family DNA glycosylase [Thermoleophilaceae bacterium]|nr:YcaQ family DNA glycosylase [Thermoleophilaceae bacterium]